jgi:dienelactone hydrolase
MAPQAHTNERPTGCRPCYRAKRRNGGQAVIGVSVVALALFASPGAFGQEKKVDEGDGKSAPEAKTVSLKTRDEITLKATYFASNKAKGKAKESVPVLMVHDFEGSRDDYKGLAAQLQSQGYAVLVPDLRGHGDSTKTDAGEDISTKTMRPADFVKMIQFDLESAKAFLMAENNKQQLNIEKLCVVGAGMGTVLAVNWTARDWSIPDLGQFKQGRDVKALVLLSPETNFKGLTTRQAMNHPAIKSEISILALVGEKDRKAMRTASSFYTMIARTHKNDEKKEPYLAELPTNLQGTKLLGFRGLFAKTLTSPSLESSGKTKDIAKVNFSPERLIASFIHTRLTSSEDWNWTDRTLP